MPLLYFQEINVLFFKDQASRSRDNEVDDDVITDTVATPTSRRPLPRQKSRDDITFRSGWRKSVKLLDLIKAKLILESRVEELEREEVLSINYFINKQ